jgi:hypothetical protein
MSVPLRHDTLSRLQPVVTDDFMQAVENIFCIATAVSPLLLLHSRQYGKTLFGRDVLMSVSRPSATIFIPS